MSRQNVRKVMTLVNSLALSETDYALIFEEIAKKGDFRYTFQMKSDFNRFIWKPSGKPYFKQFPEKWKELSGNVEPQDDQTITFYSVAGDEESEDILELDSYEDDSPSEVEITEENVGDIAKSVLEESE